MTRLIAIIALACGLCGCRAPMPEMNLLAPYGSPRVPPPVTGAYGAPSTYYQPSTTPTPAVGAGLKAEAATSTRWTQTASQPNRNELRPAPRSNGVHTASFESDESESQNRVEDASSERGPTKSLLRGMPINDATQPREPATFQPPADAIDISQLPRPDASASLVSTASVLVTPRPANRPAPSNSGGSVVTASHSSSTTAANWQSRPLASSSPRIAGH